MNTALEYNGRTDYIDQYTDFEFTDDNPRHLYCLTYDSSSEEWYGTLNISETDDDALPDERQMTDEEISYCKSLIPLFDRPERTFHRRNVG